jgi:iron complex outermembrane receptor protein
VPEGSRLPGVPKRSVYGELGWKEAAGRLARRWRRSATARCMPRTRIPPRPAPGYAIVNARAQASQEVGGWRFKEFVRLNNLFDRQYVGSVIVGDANRRFYEGAPGRNWVLGVSAQYQF